MIRGVNTRLSDTAFETGYLEDGKNLEFYANGEVRRRKGIIRSNIQKKSAQIDQIAGFHTFSGKVMMALADGDRIQGYEDPDPTEDDFTLYAPGGNVNEFAYEQFHLMPTRGDVGNFLIDGFEIFAKDGSNPVAVDEVGVRACGFLAIAADSFVAQGVWYAPEDGDWKFSARAIRDGRAGPLGPLTQITNPSDLDQDDNNNWPPWVPKPPPNLPKVGNKGGNPQNPGVPIEQAANTAASLASSGYYYSGSSPLDDTSNCELAAFAVVTATAAQIGTVILSTAFNSVGTVGHMAIVRQSDGSLVDTGSLGVVTHTVTQADTFVIYYGSTDFTGQSEDSIGSVFVTTTCTNGGDVNTLNTTLESLYCYPNIVASTPWEIDVGSVADGVYANFEGESTTIDYRTNAASAFEIADGSGPAGSVESTGQIVWAGSVANFYELDISCNYTTGSDASAQVTLTTEATSQVRFTGTTTNRSIGSPGLPNPYPACRFVEQSGYDRGTWTSGGGFSIPGTFDYDRHDGTGITLSMTRTDPTP